MDESPSCLNIPDWLPAFPDPHTYMHLPVWNEGNKSCHIEKNKRTEQRHRAKSSLLNLQQRLLPNRLTRPFNLDHCCVDDPYLSAKKGDWKHLSAQEAFDALKGGELDPMGVDRRVVSEKRALVHFKSKTGTKMLLEDLDVQLRNRANDGKRYWLSSEYENDAKKRRVEFILEQPM